MPLVKEDRFQINVEPTGPLRERFQEAMRMLRRDRADLIRLMIEDWLKLWELKGKPAWQDVLPDAGEGRASSSERARPEEHKRVTR